MNGLLSTNELQRSVEQLQRDLAASDEPDQDAERESKDDESDADDTDKESVIDDDDELRKFNEGLREQERAFAAQLDREAAERDCSRSDEPAGLRVRPLAV